MMKKFVIVTKDLYRGIQYAKDRHLSPHYTWIDADDSKIAQMKKNNRGIAEVEVIYLDEDQNQADASNHQGKLDFGQVSKTNRERALLWHRGGLGEWSVADWSNAMAGEAGEVCNAVKKLRRIETGVKQASGPQTREAAISEIKKEIGDTFLYLDLLAQRLDINIEEAIRETFNRVSEREGFPQRL